MIDNEKEMPHSVKVSNVNQILGPTKMSDVVMTPEEKRTLLRLSVSCALGKRRCCYTVDDSVRHQKEKSL